MHDYTTVVKRFGCAFPFYEIAEVLFSHRERERERELRTVRHTVTPFFLKI